VRGDRRLFSGVNLVVEPGSWVQLTGPNGSGKTSLLRMICGLLEPAEGDIRWQGQNIRSLREDYFSQLTYLGHRNGVKDELTAIENLRYASGLSGLELSNQAAICALRDLGLEGRELLPARSLSQGQRRRLALARLKVSQTTLWVLDEILTSLDRAATSLIQTILSRHVGNGGIALVATHQDLDLSAGSSQRIQLSL
jgi:heme exporter protein A